VAIEAIAVEHLAEQIVIVQADINHFKKNEP
jgi:tRNA1(Val) A37 N6-methylase TrmN6